MRAGCGSPTHSWQPNTLCRRIARWQGCRGGSLSLLVDLPIAPEEVFAGVEATLVSHLLLDHLDDVALRTLPSSMLILCQPGGEGRIRVKGFRDVTPVSERVRWGGLGQPGPNAVRKQRWW
jgi:hypothetical protein